MKPSNLSDLPAGMGEKVAEEAVGSAADQVLYVLEILRPDDLDRGAFVRAVLRMLEGRLASGPVRFPTDALTAAGECERALDQRLVEAVARQFEALIRRHAPEEERNHGPLAVRSTEELEPQGPAQAEGVPAPSAAVQRALERGKAARVALEEDEGGSKSSEQVAELLGVTRQAVDQRRRARRLVAWQDAAGHWRFPLWQFDPQTARPYPGMDSILAALPGDPWSDMIFFLSREETLGARPLDLLRSGRAKRVVPAALRYGRQGV